jgi:hypothetical protein
MRRRISSAQTYFMKFVFPVLWNISCGIGVLVFFGVIDVDWFKILQPIPPEMKWFGLGVWAYGNVMCFLINFRLKRVEIDDENLYISNYVSEEVVPLLNVADVSESRMMNPRPITIRFHESTEYGNRIVFLAKQQWFDFFWTRHPVVAEIWDAVEEQREATESQPQM